jgi:protein-tyrosine kinase
LNGQQAVLGNEEFRTLRSRLHQLQEHRPLRKLLVTSPLPEEGKTFVAANLAQAIACQEGRQVLLIDGDLRAGCLHECLGTFRTPGLSDYLLNEIDEFKVMQRGSMKNLVVIPAGSAVSNPTELLGNGRIKTLLNRTESLFDWIIIDSPPSTLVSDATLLADYCDGVLLVVRSNVTRSDAILKARHEFRDNQLVGVVLNGVQATPSAYYGSYGRKSSQASAELKK